MKTFSQFITDCMVSFGNFVLSKEREDNVSEEVKRSVTDADLANWKEKNNITDNNNSIENHEPGNGIKL
ncbi:hypothetical protein MA9V2_141 [Chryseobacterium phage MA9V-2]|nr:hypothetical protein MA9V2_141 [Chryseobacterium phage MA9V-2]